MRFVHSEDMANEDMLMLICCMLFMDFFVSSFVASDDDQALQVLLTNTN